MILNSLLEGHTLLVSWDIRVCGIIGTEPPSFGWVLFHLQTSDLLLSYKEHSPDLLNLTV